jgi:glycosyltransferase involved in cell wall biosynthesis
MVFRLTLVGDVDHGNPSSLTAGELRGWEAEGLLEWVGPVGDVRPYISSCDAIILPSYREGLPLVLLEAAAMGRPIIATDVPGCREVAIEGRTGFRFTARDERSLADAMRRMEALSAADRTAMGQAARRLAEERFDARIVVGQYLDLLRGLGV